MGFLSIQRSVPVRADSLPCRSHPRTDRIEKLINKAKIWESTSSLSNPSAENICSGFSHLTQLYECLEELVKTDMYRNSSKSNSQIMKPTDELLDTSVKFLEICTNTTEIISQTLQHLRDLGCGLRRNGGSCRSKSIITNYIVFRNKLRRDVKGSMASLKQVEKMICRSAFMLNSENHPLMISVIRAFREVTALSIVIFRLLFVYLAMPPFKTKSSTGHRWTKLISNGKVVPEEAADANVNELQHLNATLCGYGKSDNQEVIGQVVPKKLEALEATLERRFSPTLSFEMPDWNQSISP